MKAWINRLRVVKTLSATSPPDCQMPKITYKIIVSVSLIVLGCGPTTQDVQDFQKNGDITSLVKIVRSAKENDVKIAAVNALGQSGDARALEFLAENVGGGTPITGDAMAEALVKAGGKSVPVLVSELNRAYGTDQRLKIIDIIARINDPSVPDALAGILASQRSVPVRERVLGALSSQGSFGVQSIIAALSKGALDLDGLVSNFLNDALMARGAEIRRATLTFLLGSGAAVHASLRHELFRNKEPNREFAINALQGMGPKALRILKQEPTNIWAALIRAPYINYYPMEIPFELEFLGNRARVFACIDEVEVDEILLRQMKVLLHHHQSARAVELTALALGKRRVKAAVPILIDVLNLNSNPEAQRSAASSLREIGDSRASAALQEFARSLNAERTTLAPTVSGSVQIRCP